MKSIITTIDEKGIPESFKHLRTFCEKYGLKENTVCRWKFPKYIKKLNITVFKKDLI
jgi:hypothetical protein